jgi:hypothetical protein
LPHLGQGNLTARLPETTKKTIHPIATTKAGVYVENNHIESTPTPDMTGT